MPSFLFLLANLQGASPNAMPLRQSQSLWLHPYGRRNYVWCPDTSGKKKADTHIAPGISVT
jgi:hypothetical protein